MPDRPTGRRGHWCPGAQLGGQIFSSAAGMPPSCLASVRSVVTGVHQQPSSSWLTVRVPPVFTRLVPDRRVVGGSGDRLQVSVLDGTPSPSASDDAGRAVPPVDPGDHRAVVQVRHQPGPAGVSRRRWRAAKAVTMFAAQRCCRRPRGVPPAAVGFTGRGNLRRVHGGWVDTVMGNAAGAALPAGRGRSHPGAYRKHGCRQARYRT